MKRTIRPSWSKCLLLAATFLLMPALQAQEMKAAPGLLLIDTSVDVIVAAGGSSAEAAELEQLQGGGHDPKRNGFTLQQAELSLSGVIDPYLRGESHILFSEDGVELEEAFLVTRQGLGGWDAKAGYFLTEFGRVNASHPHRWAWVDQPLISTRLLGGEGLRNAGIRVGRLLPLPWYSEVYLGVQNAGGEFAASFLGGEIGHDHGAEEAHAHGEEEGHEEEHGEEEHEHAEGAGGIGGRAILDRDVEDPSDLLYSIRWTHSAEANDETTVLFGLSGLTGPNASGEDTSTWIGGADLTVKWTPERNNRGFPFVAWETEFMHRNYEAGALELEPEHEGEAPVSFGAATLRDQGFYSQVQYGFKPSWICGIRGELATGSGESIGGREQDAHRADRIRISPMLSFLPSEFSRIRLQYNYDDADFLEEAAHTVWISFEGLWGKHPAHTF